MTFQNKELQRYSRHLVLPEIGLEGQEKLKNAKVLVVGAGGLGAPVLLYLAAAGIGKIGIVDFDRVEESNLQRQVLFQTKDIGRLKATVSSEKIQALNPYIQTAVFNIPLSVENAADIFEGYDLVVDGTDNFPTRYLVNDACVLLNKVNIYGSIFRFEGQVSVFNYLRNDGSRGPNYRDIFPEPPPPGQVPNCAEGGVLGMLPGIIGSMQANEAIKVITGAGTPLDGKLFLFDALSMESMIVKIPIPKVRKTITKLEILDEYCMNPVENNFTDLITVSQYKNMKDQGIDHQLIDVRESWEHTLSNIGGLSIPQHQIFNSLENIKKDKDVIVYCRSGKRSGDIVTALRQKGFKNLYSLKGGILAWADEIDQTLTKY